MKPSLRNHARPGDNRTGVALHPEYARTMVEGTAEFGPTSSGGIELLGEERRRVAQLAEPVATMPPSPKVSSDDVPLLDKLGARLAFERTGVRLYQALLVKLDVYGAYEGGPTRADLEHIRDEERKHLRLAQQLIVELGGDPTAVTPHANLQAVASHGICEILVDPRTTLIECLEAIVVAELTDHESWEQLVGAAERSGKNELVAKVRDAVKTEAEHLGKVRAWIAAAAKRVSRGD